MVHETTISNPENDEKEQKPSYVYVEQEGQ
jgi:hypothetical protein